MIDHTLIAQLGKLGVTRYSLIVENPQLGRGWWYALTARLRRRELPPAIEIVYSFHPTKGDMVYVSPRLASVLRSHGYRVEDVV